MRNTESWITAGALIRLRVSSLDNCNVNGFFYDCYSDNLILYSYDAMTRSLEFLWCYIQVWLYLRV